MKHINEIIMNTLMISPATPSTVPDLIFDDIYENVRMSILLGTLDNIPSVIQAEITLKCQEK